MAHQYLLTDLTDARIGDTVTLTGSEAKHAATVSRIRVGETIRVSNGRGLIVTGEVRTATPSAVELRVEAVQTQPAAQPPLWLVQALAKGDRDELAIQAATELGVDRVIPWAAARSISRWDAAKAIKGRDRWQTIVDEAAKQSLRAWTPSVSPLHDTAELEAIAAQPDVLMLVCVPGAESALASLDLDDRTVCLVVGPEGGLEPREIERLVTAGAEPVRLGPEVLRTSTAGPAALAVLAARLGRWA